MTKDKAFEVLDITPETPYQKAYNRFRYLIRKHHPDKGGDKATAANIIEAWKAVKESLKNNTEDIKHLGVISLWQNDYNPKVFHRPVLRNGEHWFITYHQTSKNIYKLDIDGILSNGVPQSQCRLHHGKNATIEIIEPIKVWERHNCLEIEV